MPWELQLIDSQGNIPLHLHFDESKNVSLTGKYRAFSSLQFMHMLAIGKCSAVALNY